MGYTHYWNRKPEFNKEDFNKVVADFNKMIPVFNRIGLTLTGGDGTGKPEINDNTIWFNGNIKCGHTERDLGITWPSKDAGGMTLAYKTNGNHKEDSDIGGQWFAGLELKSRTCGGDCSHEPFGLSLVKELGGGGNDKFLFDFCKTAYKPYDLAVICALIIAKHHLKEQIRISSDGTLEQWKDGIVLCEKVLGYGVGFAFHEEDG